MKIPFKLNPITHFIFLLILVIFSSLAAFCISFSNHKSTGIISPRFTFKEVYYCEPWTFHLGKYSFYLPKESIITPVFHEENFRGIIIQKNKEGLTISEGNLSYDITAGFLAINHETFLQLKGDILFLPLEDGYLKKRVLSSARQQIKLPEVKSIGFTQVFLPPLESYYIYLENGSVQLDFALPYLENNYNWLLLYFGLMVLIIILVVQILTLDLHPSGKLLQLLANTPPTLQELLLALGIFPAVLLAEKFSGFNPFDSRIHPLSMVAYYIILILLFILAKKQIITLQKIILNVQHLDRCIILALVVSFIIMAFSAFKFPSGILPGFTYQGLALYFSLYFFYALGKEFFWRGFLQTLLERLWGKWSGLILTPLIFSFIFFLVFLVQNQGMAPSPHDSLELFFFVPATSFILGYIYYRSRNIFSSTLLHALLLFLPRFLTF